MCYRLTFFLHLYLAERHVGTKPVVGFINDGTDNVMVSHAWLELGGKKTDLTLAKTERPDLNLPGDVLILDFPIRRAHRYTYHLKRTPQAIELEERWLRRPNSADVVKQKAAEHERMNRLSGSADEMRSFLDSAPDGLNFVRLASIIDDRPLR